MPAPRRTFGRMLGWTALAALLGVTVWLSCAPTDVDPVEWPSPPPGELVGAWAPNDALAQHVAISTGTGPEDIAVGPDGRWFTGIADGRILAIAADGTTQMWAQTGGRPLGLAFAKDGSLWVADARAGLLRFDSSGALQTTIDTVDDGTEVALADELAIAQSGVVWFTDASTRWDVDDVTKDALEGRATGRILRHDPIAGTTTVELDGLRFANGIVLVPGEESLLVAETFAYRVTRLWIQGERRGRTEVFVDALPGFVDNLSLDDDGTVWLGFASLRSGLLDGLLPHPWVRRVLSRIPEALIPEPPPYGLVLGLDLDAATRFALHDPNGVVHATTSAVPVGDKLVLGSLHAESIVVVPRPRPQ